MHEKEQEQECNFAAQHTIAHLLVGLLHQPLHVVVDLDHLGVGVINVTCQSIQLLVLVAQFSTRVLSLPRDNSRDSNQLINLPVLLIHVPSLLLENLL